MKNKPSSNNLNLIKNELNEYKEKAQLYLEILKRLEERTPRRGLLDLPPFLTREPMKLTKEEFEFIEANSAILQEQCNKFGLGVGSVREAFGMGYHPRFEFIVNFPVRYKNPITRDDALVLLSYVKTTLFTYIHKVEEILANKDKLKKIAKKLTKSEKRNLKLKLRENANNRNDIIEFINNLFWKPTVEIPETRLFKNESGLHSKLLEVIKTQLNQYQIIELHNPRDEISTDLLFKCKKFNWKIGISVEATSDIAEINKEKRDVSFPKTIKAKMTDIDRIADLDLFVILFCIDLTVKSYKDTLHITKAELEQIDDPKVIYIPPENLVGFFQPFIQNSK